VPAAAAARPPHGETRPRPRPRSARPRRPPTLASSNGDSSIICRPWQICQRYLQQRIWFGLVKLDVKTKSASGIAKGLKLTFDTTFSPNTGKKSGKIKSAYKRECLNLGCDVDFDFAGPAIHGSAVFGYEGWLAGYQMTFDSAKSKLTRNNFSVGYKTGDFQLHTNVNDGSEFGGSIYQKVSDNLETAVNLAWTAGSNSTRFGIAAKYKLDSTASISAKVNNSSLVGVGYTQTLRPGVKLTLSALIDGKSINAGGHKLGLGLELEA
uniref:Non-selective voltage-gated ion channel VDAC2 n=1 Tax=Gallus gallus TaxID=9031 RepID=A0A8V0ZHC7_CHICK